MSEPPQVNYFNASPIYLLLRRLHANNLLNHDTIEPIQEFMHSHDGRGAHLNALLEVAEAWSSDMEALELVWDLSQAAPERLTEERLSRACGQHLAKLASVKRFLSISAELELTSADFRAFDELRDFLGDSVPFRELAQLPGDFTLTAQQLQGIVSVFNQVQGDDVASDLFRGFMVDIALNHPEELPYFDDYEPPSGSLKGAEVVHLLEWPPTNKIEPLEPLSPILKDEKNETIKFVKASFPAWKKHFAFDIFPKRLPYPKVGARHDLEAVLGDQTILVKCFQLFEQYVLHLTQKPESGRGPIIIIHSNWVRRIFEKSLGVGSELKIGDCQHTIYKLNHPAFLRRYAGVDTLLNHIELYHEIHRAHDIMADTSKLRHWKENRLTQNDDQFDVEDFPHERRDGAELQNHHEGTQGARIPSKINEQIRLWQEMSLTAIAGISSTICGAPDLLRTVCARPKKQRKQVKRRNDIEDEEDSESKKPRAVKMVGRRYKTISPTAGAFPASCSCLHRLSEAQANTGVDATRSSITKLMEVARTARDSIFDMGLKTGRHHAHALSLRYKTLTEHGLIHLTSSTAVMKLGSVPKEDQNAMSVIQVASQLIAGIGSIRTQSIPMAQYGPYESDRHHALQIEVETHQKWRLMDLWYTHKLPVVGVELNPLLREHLEADLASNDFSDSCRTVGVFRDVIYALHEGLDIMIRNSAIRCIALTNDGQWRRKTAKGEINFSQQAEDSSTISPAADPSSEGLTASPIIQDSSRDTSSPPARMLTAGEREWYSAIRELAANLGSMHFETIETVRIKIAEDPAESRETKVLLTVERSLPGADLYADGNADARRIDTLAILISFIRYARRHLIKSFQCRERPIEPIEKTVNFGPPLKRHPSELQRAVLRSLREEDFKKKSRESKYPVDKTMCGQKFDAAIREDGIFPIYRMKLNGKAHFTTFVALRNGHYNFAMPLVYIVAQADAVLESDTGIKEVMFLDNKTWRIERGDGKRETFRFQENDARESAVLETMLYDIEQEEVDHRRAKKHAKKLAKLESAKTKEDKEQLSLEQLGGDAKGGRGLGIELTKMEENALTSVKRPAMWVDDGVEDLETYLDGGDWD